MVPLFALFLLAGAEPTAPPAMSAPYADNPADFRLAAEVDNAEGWAKAIININETSTTADGHPWARVYLVGGPQPAPTVYVAYVKFDCAARSLLTEYAWAMNRDLEAIGEMEMNESIAPPVNSLGAQQVEFMCGGRGAQLQRQYLGSDMQAAIRLADARFR